MVSGRNNSRNMTMDSIQQQIDATVEAAVERMTELVEGKMRAALDDLSRQPSTDNETFALATQKAAEEAVAAELRRQANKVQRTPTHVSLSRGTYPTLSMAREHQERISTLIERWAFLFCFVSTNCPLLSTDLPSAATSRTNFGPVAFAFWMPAVLISPCFAKGR